MRPKHKTLHVPAKYSHFFEDKFPNAGPNPNITGMKEQYWGMDAYCIKCGQYVYEVDKNTYYQWERIY